MLISCIVRMVTKYRDNSYRKDGDEYTPLLNDDNESEDEEADAKLIDVDVDVRFIEDNMKETEVDAKLIETDDSEGK